jgi:hypothetical protein
VYKEFGQSVIIHGKTLCIIMIVVYLYGKKEEKTVFLLDNVEAGNNPE